MQKREKAKPRDASSIELITFLLNTLNYCYDQIKLLRRLSWLQK